MKAEECRVLSEARESLPPLATLLLRAAEQGKGEGWKNRQLDPHQGNPPGLQEPNRPSRTSGPAGSYWFLLPRSQSRVLRPILLTTAASKRERVTN